MKRLVYAHVLLSLFLLALAGCGRPAQPPAETAPPEEPAAPEASLPVSKTAVETEARLTDDTGAPPLPPDHWLVGTSDAPDMVPAVIAPAAPRQLLREHGPAYLEQIGETRVLHLKGSYYDMGVQHGTLMRDEIKVGANLIKTVGTLGWQRDKDYATTIREAWDRTSPFIPEKFKEEIRGMAEGAEMPLEEVQNFTIFPELFHCSGFAVWGKATADGALLHGRVLDYMRDVGLDKFALLIIQEPDGANAIVNVGYSGMIGSVSGMNAKQVAIGEMGGGGEGKWDGMPMTLLVRDCLERGDTLEDVRQIMTETPRTCEYYYVVSDAKANNGRGSAFGVAAVPETITFIGPNEHHPQLNRPVEDAVLLSAGERYTCLVDRVEKMYGKITPQIGLDLMARGVAMKSNMHNVLFKPGTLELWVAHSTIAQPASNRPYTHYDLKQLMNEKPAP